MNLKAALAAIVGGVVVHFLDRGLDINLSDAGSAARIIHSLMYMLWGVAVYHFSMEA